LHHHLIYQSDFKKAVSEPSNIGAGFVIVTVSSAIMLSPPVYSLNSYILFAPSLTLPPPAALTASAVITNSFLESLAGTSSALSFLPIGINPPGSHIHFFTT
jgi:hypothetical protein